MTLLTLLNRSLYARAALLGGVAGCVEVGLRASPRLGMTLAETLVWLGLGVLTNLVLALAAALVARRVCAWGPAWLQPRALGLVGAALIGLHAGLWVRFELVLNLYVRDPRVWGSLLVVLLLSAALGLLLDPLLRRASGPLAALGGVSALWAMWFGAPLGPAPRVDGPNVVLITWDTTRPDRLGVYGGPARTPVLGQLASEGATFEQAISVAPLTEPAHLSILTGLDTAHTGLVVNGTDLGDRPELLSWRFRQAGYRTGAAVSGFPLHGKYGWGQGFDVYDDDFGQVPGLHRLSLIRALDQLFLPGNTLRERPGRQTIQRALRFVERQSGGPFFFWLHLFDPHAPYESDDLSSAPTDGAPLALPSWWPPPYRRITSTEWLVQAYDHELETTDAITGQLVVALAARGLLDRTVIVMAADHGESLTEHDYLFEHGDNLYDPSLRVPLIVRVPGGKARRVGCQVSVTDIAPTLLDLAKIPFEASTFTGHSLVPQLSGAECGEEPTLSSAPAGRFPDPPIDYSLRRPESKYIAHGATSVGGEELYDLSLDPGELVDIAHLADLAPWREQMRAAREGAREHGQTRSDAASLEALRALGYVE